MILRNPTRNQLTTLSNATESFPVASFANNEYLNSVTLRSIFFSGSVVISNTAGPVLTLEGTDHWNLGSQGAGLSFANTDTITVTVANGSALMCFDKKSAYIPGTENQLGYEFNI